jgi:N utilization substance protein B
MRSPRRRAREFALQGIYQWLVAGNESSAIESHLAGVTGFEKVDAALFTTLLRGVIHDAGSLGALIEPCLDRPLKELSPVEHAILLLAALELRDHLQTPYRVVLNEAIEIAKSYGGTDGYKYVNGVLDRLAPELRPVEAGRDRMRRDAASS